MTETEGGRGPAVPVEEGPPEEPSAGQAAGVEGRVENDADGASAEEEPGALRRRRVMMEWGLVAVVAIVAALLVRAFVFEAFFIPSQSMEPTLYPQDRVVVNRLSYDVHPVHTGDIVVFSRPPADTSTMAADLIKRVIGLPGQTISVRNCRIFINGRLLPQPYLPKGWQDSGSEYCTVWDGPGMLHLPNPYQVPSGTYFVMGDNRQDSDDSRFWGPLPGKYIVGRAFLKIWPLGRIRFL